MLEARKPENRIDGALVYLIRFGPVQAPKTHKDQDEALSEPRLALKSK